MEVTPNRCASSTTLAGPISAPTCAATVLIDQLQTTYTASNESRAAENQSAEDPGTEDSLPNQAWIDLAHSIYNLKEFIYVR